MPIKEQEDIEHQIDWTIKEIPMTQSNQNTKHTEQQQQYKNIRKPKEKRPRTI